MRENFTRASSGAYESGALGVAVAVSLSDGNANALLDGEVLAGGAIDVISTADTPQNDTEASAGVGSGLGPTLVKGAASGLASFFARASPVPKPQSGSQPLAVSASFAYAEHTTTSTARIGAGAEAIALDGDVLVNATTTDLPEISSIATVDSDKLSASPTGLTKENSVTAAILVGNYDNDTTAFIGENAVVSASGDVTVDAETSLPYQIQWFQFNEFADINDKLNSNFGIQNGFFTSSAQSNAQGTELVVSGTVNVLDVNNETRAYIAEGALINQDTVFDPANTVDVVANEINFGFDHGLLDNQTVVYNNGGGDDIVGLLHGQTYFVQRVDSQTIRLRETSGGATIDLALPPSTSSTHSFTSPDAHGQVHVVARAQTETVNLSGVFGLKFFGTQSGVGGVGGAYLEFGNTNVTVAEIRNDVQIYGDAMRVSSESDARSISIAESGGQGDSLSLNGSFGNNETTNVTTSRVDDGANIVLGDAPIIVDKNISPLFGDDERTYFTDNTVGQGVMIEDIPAVLDSDRDGAVTTADEHVTASSSGSYTTDLSELVYAEDEAQIYTVGGGIAKSRNVGVGFTVGLNEINRFVEAVIGQVVFGGDAVNAASDEIQLGHPHNLSTGDPVKYNNGGGTGIDGLANEATYFAIVIDPTTIRLATSLTNAENGIAITTLDPSSATGAGHSIRGVDEVLGGGSIASDGEALVAARGEGIIGSFSLAAAVTSDTPTNFQPKIGPQSAGRFGLGFSGAVSLNTIDDAVGAYVSHANLSHSGDLAISALNDTLIVGLSGAAAVSFNASSASGGLAGSYAQNTLLMNTRAFVIESELSVIGNLDLSATSDGDITVVTVGGAGAASGPALAGAVSINDITSNTFTVIEKSDVTLGREDLGVANLTLAATDDTGIFAIAGTLGKGGAMAGVGSTVALNDIAGGAQADLIDSDIDVVAAGGLVAVLATTTAEIQALAAALGFSPSLAAAISVSENTIANTTRATINRQKSRGIKSRGGGLTVSATDTSTIDALAGSIAGGANAAGAAVGTNDISNTIGVGSEATNIDVAGAITMSGTSTATINALTVGGAGADSFALGGSVSLNDIVVSIDAHLANASTVKGSSLSLTGTNTSTINAFAGGFAGAGGSAVGAAVSTNVVANTTEVDIRNASVNVTGATTVTATGNATIEAITVGGAGAASFAAGGSVSLNEIENVTEAVIAGSPTVKGASLSLTANDTSTIHSFAGGFASGTNAVGASLATNDIGNRTEVGITNSSVDVTGAVIAASTSTPTIEAIAVGGAGAGSFALGGSVSLNEIDNVTEAVIAGSPTVKGASLSLTANDTSFIASFAGGFAVGLSAVGAALATNEIGNRTEVGIRNTSVDVTGAVIAAATSTPTIEASAVGGAGAGGFALGGSVSLNQIDNVTAAQLLDAPMVKGSSMSLTASDTSKIDSFSGGFAISIAGAAVGAALSTNNIGNTIETGITNSSVDVTGAVTVSATSTATIDSIAVGGAGAGSFALGGSVSTNDIGNTVKARVRNSPMIKGGSLALTANDNSTITGFTGGFAVAFGAFAVGAAITTNDVRNTVETTFDGSEAMLQGGATITATSDTDVDSRAVGGAGAISFAGAGSSIDTEYDSSTTVRVGDNSEVDADGVVTIRARTLTDVVNNAGSYSGAIVGVGLAFIDVVLNNVTDASVGSNAVVTSGGDLIVLADTDHFIDSNSVYGGGGAVAAAEANSALTVDDKTITTVGANARLEAGGDLDVIATMDTDADSFASVTAIGGVTIGISGASTDATGDTDVIIEAGAQLRGDHVNVAAQVTEFDADSEATSYAGAVGADANATATTTTNSAANLTVFGSARIVGEESLVLRADQVDLPTRRKHLPRLTV